MSTPSIEPPSLVLGPLSLWVHGRQFPDHTDYSDGNWLDVTIVCEGEGAVVRVAGPLIHAPELLAWQRDLRSLYTSLQGSANLEPMEPEFSVLISSAPLGHVAVRVNITPDHLNQRHSFEFEADQTHIGALISQLAGVLSSYPVVGEP